MALQLWVAFTHPSYSPYSASSGGGGTGSNANGVQALRADAVVNTFGTNIHMDTQLTSDVFNSVIIPTMLDVGIRNVRSGCSGTGSDSSIALVNSLNKEVGVQYLLVAGFAGGTMYSNMGIQQYMFSQIDPTICFAIEGPNEVDNNATTWGGNGVYGANVSIFVSASKAWHDTHPDARVRSRLMTTPTVTSNQGSKTGSAWQNSADLVAFHPYELPAEPGVTLTSSMANLSAMNTTGKPWIVTETGYTCAPSASNPSYLIGAGCSNLAQAKYLQRQYMEHALQGMYKTMHYEYIDDSLDFSNGESNWGLVTSNGTKKLSFRYIKNLIGLLQEVQYVPPSSSVGNGDLIFDDFNRVDAAGWGNAPGGTDTNKTWTAQGGGNETADWAVSGSTGVSKRTFQVFQNVGDSHGGPQEVEIEATGFALSANDLIKVWLRSTLFSNCYEFWVLNSSANQLNILKVIGGAGSTMIFGQKPEVNHAVSASMKFRIIPSGSDNYLYAKMWNTTGSEPSGWDLTTVDVGGNNTIVSGGKAGLWVDNGNSINTIHIDQFKSSTVSSSFGVWPTLTPFVTGTLDYKITSASGFAVKTLLMQKADSSFWLAAWSRAPVWNSGSVNDITNTPISCSIMFNTGSRNVTRYVPGTSQTGSLIGNGLVTASFMALDEVILLQIV